jgi:hypothetical protein
MSGNRRDREAANVSVRRGARGLFVGRERREGLSSTRTYEAGWLGVMDAFSLAHQRGASRSMGGRCWTRREEEGEVVGCNLSLIFRVGGLLDWLGRRQMFEL